MYKKDGSLSSPVPTRKSSKYNEKIPPPLEVFKKPWMWHSRTWFNDGRCGGAGLMVEDLKGL